MASKREKRIDSQTGSLSSTHVNTVLILVDNISPAAVSALGDQNTLILTSRELSLPEGTDDPTLLKKFMDVAATASATAWIATADRGHVMKGEVKKYPALLSVTTSIKGTDNQLIAFMKLQTIQGFKRKHMYSKQYRKISLQKMGHALRIEYITIKGKRKIKDIQNVFPN
jgi:fumarylacetoacetate (FAA) hydrolase family protein